jgi:hypothetical protein
MGFLKRYNYDMKNTEVNAWVSDRSTILIISLLQNVHLRTNRVAKSILFTQLLFSCRELNPLF